MNIKLIIIIAVIICLLLIIPIFNPIKKPDNQLELTYKISAGIPFRWEYEIEDETIVKFVKSYVKKDYNTGGKTGAPIYRNYVFEGLKEGTTTITFKLVHITDEEPKVASTEVHKIKVGKNNKITEIHEKE